MRSIALTFLTWNRLRTVSRCFRSMRNTLLDKRVSWYILDNASTDGTAQWLQKLAAHNPKVHIDLATTNLGVAGGRVRLLENVGENADVIVFLDSDVEAQQDDWLDKLIAPLDNPAVGVCGPGGHNITPDWKTYTSHSQAGRVDCVSGYCQAFWADLTKEVSMDIAYGRYWHEDTDWCLQAASLGYEIHCTGPIGLQHIYSGSGATSDGRLQQRYLASKWAGEGLIHAERLHNA